MGRPIAEVWADHEAWWKINAPTHVRDLDPPATARAVGATERKLGRALPLSLRRLLLLRGGASDVFGHMDLLSLAGIERESELLRNLNKSRHRRGLVPFAVNGGGDLLVIDKKGQVLDAPHDDEDETLVATSLEAWLETLVAAMHDATIRWDAERGLLPTLGVEGFSFLRRRRFVALAGAAPVEIDGPAELQVYGVEATRRDVAGLVFVLSEGPRELVFDVRRDAAEQGPLVTTTGPKLHIRKKATLHARGLEQADTVWIHFTGDEVRWRRTEPVARLAAAGSKAPKRPKKSDRLALLLHEDGPFDGPPGRLWGVLDAPRLPLPPEDQARATVRAAVAKYAKVWPRSMTGTTAQARRVHEALLTAWGRSRSGASTTEVDAALARLLVIWPDPALEALISTWIARGGLPHALTVLAHMNDFVTMLPVACILAREVDRSTKTASVRAKEEADALRAEGSPALRLALLRVFRDPAWAHEDVRLLDAETTRAAEWTVFRSATDRRILDAVLKRLSKRVEVLYPGPIVERLGKAAVPVLQRQLERLNGVEPFARRASVALQLAAQDGSSG